MNNEKVKGWGYVVGSIIGGLVIAGAVLFAFNEASKESVAANPENQITTSGGLVVKMGKVTAELPQTKITVGSGVGITVPIADAAKELASLMAEAGVKDMSVLTGNLTVCMITAITYKTELAGFISTQIKKECRNFVPGMYASTINTFAEGYTVETVADYRANYSFINKGSK